eukprot:GDKJ01064384.1.p1 GENE.GDKJ01064384.1~~GDKJ01064384.1.p1  ORF type:complete len:113 (-),score=8.58 GDKJ01064384.1:72-386(-)
MIMVLGLIVGLWELATTHRTQRSARRTPSSPAAVSVLDVPLLDIDSTWHKPADDSPKLNPIPHPLLATASSPVNDDDVHEDVANSERETVRLILAQLKDFEELL